jgi:uncharacterized protein with HEPN domain
MSLPEGERDSARLCDMIDHALRAIGHLRDLDEAAFRASPLHQDAAIRALGVIGAIVPPDGQS